MSDQKGNPEEKQTKDHHGNHDENHNESVSPFEKYPFEAPEIQLATEPINEPMPTDLELLIKEVEATRIARPKRIRSKELKLLLPFYKPKPSNREPHLVVWTDLDYSAVLQLSQAKDSDDIRRILAERLTLCDSISNPKDQIVLDLFCQVVNQATKMKLNFEQTSAFFSIVRNIHLMAIETPLDNSEDCLKYMDNMLCRHIVKRPPWSARIFDVYLAKSIRDFVIRTYFRHLAMYKYAFTPSICMDLKIEYVNSDIIKPTPSPSDSIMKIAKISKLIFLEEVLKEIDMEEKVEKAISEGLPFSILTVAPPTKDKATASADLDTKSVAAVEVSLDPRLAELELIVSRQMDAQLNILRERITDKLREVDDTLRKATGTETSGKITPIDQFSLPTEKHRSAETDENSKEKLSQTTVKTEKVKKATKKERKK